MLLCARPGAHRIHPGVTRDPRGAGIMPIKADSAAAGNRCVVITRMNGPSGT